MRRFAIRAWALALLTAALGGPAQAGGPVMARGQTDDPPAPTQESLQKAQANEYKLYQERDRVCFKLKKIAIETNDEDLFQQAVTLETMAWKCYELRAQKLNDLTAATPSAADAAPVRRPARPKQALRAPNGRPIREDNP